MESTGGRTGSRVPAAFGGRQQEHLQNAGAGAGLRDEPGNLRGRGFLESAVDVAAWADHTPLANARSHGESHA